MQFSAALGRAHAAGLTGGSGIFPGPAPPSGAGPFCWPMPTGRLGSGANSTFILRWGPCWLRAVGSEPTCRRFDSCRRSWGRRAWDIPSRGLQMQVGSREPSGRMRSLSRKEVAAWPAWGFESLGSRSSCCKNSACSMRSWCNGSITGSNPVGQGSNPWERAWRGAMLVLQRGFQSRPRGFDSRPRHSNDFDNRQRGPACRWGRPILARLVRWVRLPSGPLFNY